MELLARRGQLGVRAIAAALDLPLGSAHRLLRDLELEEVASRTPSGEWELSHRLLEISGLHLDRANFPAMARPFAERIAKRTGETVNIHILSGMHGVIVDKIRGNEGMQLDFPIGSLGMLHYGGAGKAVLAYLSDEVRERVLGTAIPAETPYTITDPAALRSELGRIRQRGYSIDNQEVVLGVYCVAVPVLGRNGRPLGALSVSGPGPKAPGPEILPLVDMLNEACGHVSRRLGYIGVFPPAFGAEGGRREVG
jgi:DNA-binding IclR family transcriptional regulator